MLLIFTYQPIRQHCRSGMDDEALDTNHKHNVIFPFNHDNALNLTGFEQF